MKKYQDGGGIREGRATSIKDDVRERARKAIEENMEREERGVEAMPVAMPRKSKPTSLTPTSLTPTSPTPTSPTPTSPTPKAKSKAEEAYDKMFERNGPIGDAIDGIKNSELVKKLRGSMNIGSMQGRFRGKTDSGMKKGGAVKSSASKRGDGCAIRGKTKGMMR